MIIMGLDPGTSGGISIIETKQEKLITLDILV